MATTVEFHTGVADKREFACRLLRKAYRSGARVVVCASAQDISALDRELWTFDERDFVPHVRIGAAGSAALAARTPIWLVEGEPGPDAQGVLVNLGPEVAAAGERFERLIEIVSAEPEDEAAGRARWREYKARGFEIRHLPARRP